MPEQRSSSIRVTRTYLELRAPDALRGALSADPAIRVDRVADCPVAFFRFLYREVGERYHWRDRLGWSDERCRAHLADPRVTLWVLYRAGAPAGWFELQTHDADRSVEIAYFGLLPDFVGRGLGKHLLTVAAMTAWSGAPARVWLHTCTLDDPAALPNYLARGFTPYKSEEYDVVD